MVQQNIEDEFVAAYSCFHNRCDSRQVLPGKCEKNITPNEILSMEAERNKAVST